MPQKHTFQSAVPDAGVSGEVSPNDWNAEHTGQASGQVLDFILGVNASAAATNNPANTFVAVSDPSLRVAVDMRGIDFFRIQGRLGGTLVAQTAIRVQYHLGGNINVATGDAGWATLGDSAGSHTLSTVFESADITVPTAAKVQGCIIRMGIFGGDGVVDPTITLGRVRLI